MEQEQLDDKMLETGKVPSDAINRLPAAANGERTYPPILSPFPSLPTTSYEVELGRMVYVGS